MPFVRLGGLPAKGLPVACWGMEWLATEEAALTAVLGRWAGMVACIAAAISASRSAATKSSHRAPYCGPQNRQLHVINEISFGFHQIAQRRARAIRFIAVAISASSPIKATHGILCCTVCLIPENDV